MNILLGITGSIAAYKVLGLIRQRTRRGDQVKTILTRSAQHFTTALSCQTLTGCEVYMEQFVLSQGIKHLALSAWADILVVAPATANIIGKAACGIADDLLSTTIVSFPKPVLFVPAMDTGMWENSIVQRNVRSLREAGYRVLEPASGALASGKTGRGRFPEVELIDRAIDVVNKGLESLEGRNVLITGGRTEEDIDPVRVVTNRSSGTMARELLYAVVARSGNARCIMGPTSITIPEGLDVIQVRTARDMLKEMKQHVPWCDCLIMAAAVGDYTPLKKAAHKVHERTLSLRLEKNADILKTLLPYKQHRYFIGFSLEDQQAVARARKKLRDKGLDCIVLNGRAAIGQDVMQARLLRATGAVQSLGKISKRNYAHHILDMYLRYGIGRT
ncbi:bifunctional phosphopantothenoylcysteine decarboxylase/phosphopantothenate--cysteine ligase CoaBC [candidate division WOR-3 bacterium]|nr:bifunctional phosphopantothenoylcysteine decarboxylase/phosphopantothenate--cysteine ligase CoaBC [candidate division WOR-3 bacterium]